MSPQKAKSESDSFLRIKHMGYVMSQGPLDGKGRIEEFVEYAKFQLCLSRHYLMNDPVWDRYTDEGILVEYFAERFINDKKSKEEFERSASGGSNSADAFAEWAESKIEENKSEIEKWEEQKLKEMGIEEIDGFEFEPSSIGEG